MCASMTEVCFSFNGTLGRVSVISYKGDTFSRPVCFPHTKPVLKIICDGGGVGGRGLL